MTKLHLTGTGPEPKNNQKLFNLSSKQKCNYFEEISQGYSKERVNKTVFMITFLFLNQTL